MPVLGAEEHERDPVRPHLPLTLQREGRRRNDLASTCVEHRPCMKQRLQRMVYIKQSNKTPPLPSARDEAVKTLVLDSVDLNVTSPAS